MTDIGAIVRARSDLFEADFATGDAARLVANYYVEEPRVILPDSPMLVGRAAAAALFADLIQAYAACTLTQIDVRRDGDLAYELGEATVAPRDATAAPLAARYLIIWHRAGAEWRVGIDFFAWGDLGLDSAAAS